LAGFQVIPEGQVRKILILSSKRANIACEDPLRLRQVPPSGARTHTTPSRLSRAEQSDAEGEMTGWKAVVEDGACPSRERPRTRGVFLIAQLQRSMAPSEPIHLLAAHRHALSFA
jgi:hypothetical protein